MEEGLSEGGAGDSLQLGEGAIEQPGDDGEIAALVVGWEQDGVFILLRFWSHCEVEAKSMQAVVKYSCNVLRSGVK